jgi:hypothetical protein
MPSKSFTGSSAASIDGSDATSYRITTGKSAPPSAGVAIVKSYGDILREYPTHPEHKFQRPDGQSCRRNIRGIL